MDSSYPISNIISPCGNDILCGRGGGTNAHPGNIKFRKLVAAHKLRYLAASKSDKPKVARDVVREWRAMDPPGRFLAKMDGRMNPSGGQDEDEDSVLWYDVGDKKAREKASQCLRERNGAANEAVNALVKTVTASGEACPEDYATLMNKAAMVKAQNELTLQQQKEMLNMGQQQQQYNMGGNVMGGGGGGNFCQEAMYNPMSFQQQQQQQRNNNRFSPAGNDGYQQQSYQNNPTEDDLIEAEIQRLLKQRQQQLMENQGSNNDNNFGLGSSDNRNANAGRSMMSNNEDNSNSVPQPYMGEENVMREYEQLMQRQRELNNIMANKMNSRKNEWNDDGGNGMGGRSMNGGMGGMMNGGGNMNNNMMGMMGNNGMNNNMRGMMNNNMGRMMPQSQSPGAGMGGMNGNNFGGGMQSNHNPDAAKDYMNRLRMLRQGGGGGGNNMSEQAVSSSSGGGYNNNIGNSGMMNNMGNNSNSILKGKTMGGGGAGPEFTIEEYQASLQQFLSHNDDFGAAAADSSRRIRADLMVSQEANTSSNNGKDNMMSGTMQCLQVPTNLQDGGGNKNNRRGSLRSVDDMDVPMGRNTFKSVESVDRPSFQSMDDMDIRGTFKSVDTMDLMSIGNSINEIIEEDIEQNGPDVRKKYSRQFNAANRQPKGGNNTNNPSLNNFTHLAGETADIRTMDHGRGSGISRGGSKKKKGMIDPRLMRHTVQTKDCDGPSGGGRGSQLSIYKDLNLDGVDDGSRISFGNMSVMSELTDFQEMMAKAQGDRGN